MKLRLVGKPSVNADSSFQKLVVSYNKKTEVTTIDCDLDITTLGLVVYALQQEFDLVLDELNDEYMAAKIRRTTREAARCATD